MLRFFDAEIHRGGKKNPFRCSLQAVGDGNSGVRNDLARQVVDVAHQAGLKQAETFSLVRTLIEACPAINGKPLDIEIDPNNSVHISAKTVPYIADPAGYDVSEDRAESSLGLG
jgi:hypothetical protein